MQTGRILNLSFVLSPLSFAGKRLGLACRNGHERTDKGQRTKDTGQTQGFTLLELMIVMTLILILASLVTPTYHLAIVRAREAVLRDDLYTLRTLIDQYTTDKQQPPQALQDLVDAGYLRSGLPVDPFTQSADTWRVDIEEVPLNPQQGASGIVDVHSGSDEISSDGETAYSSW